MTIKIHNSAPIRVLACAAAFLVPGIASAQAVITEIMYDPVGTDSGHEWIEVYDAGTSSILLTDWKIYEGGTNHGIAGVGDARTLDPGAYAVIAANAADFASDHPGFSGALFHSAFSLSNTGETITLRDKSLADIDAVSYESAWGAVGDGNSLQRAPGGTGAFQPRLPTPGAAISATAIAPKAKPVAAPAAKDSKSSSETKPRERDTPPVGSDPTATSSASAQIAAAATATGDDTYWWLAAIGLAAIAAGAIVASRHFKKQEWDIVEESEEDV